MRHHRWSFKINYWLTDFWCWGVTVLSVTDSRVYILIPSAKDYEPVKVTLENHSITLEFINQRLIDVEALMNDSKVVIKILDG